MNKAHIHLIVNHLPAFLLLSAIAITLYALVFKKEDFKKFGLIVFIFASIATVPTYFSGEPAEEIVEDLPNVSEHMIEEHEELAEKVFVMTDILGLLALITFFLKDKKQQVALVSLILLGTVTEGLVFKTNSLGGQIRHSEIREGSNYAKDKSEGKDKGSKDKSDKRDKSSGKGKNGDKDND